MAQKSVTAAALALSGWLLSTFTFVFGAVPMLHLAELVPAAAYWAIVTFGFGISWALGAASAGVFFLSVSTLVFAYHVLNKKYSPFTTVFSSVIISSLTLLGSGLLWMRFQSKQADTLKATAVQTLQKVYPDLGAEQVTRLVHDISQQLPSIALILVSLALWMGLVFMPKTRRVSTRQHDSLFYGFQAPDLTIWLFILSLFGSFFTTVPDPLRAIAANLLNVTILIYFFQGLSIILCYMRSYRVSTFWRVFSIVLLTTQLFLFVSVFGMMDYWVAFRERLKKKNENQPDKEWMGS